MRDTIIYLAVLIIGMAIFASALGYNADRQAARAHAQAAVIRAQSQARLDATSAYLPYVILGVSLIVGGGMVGLGCVMVWCSGQREAVAQRVIVERYVVVLPEGGRRAMWEQLADIGMIGTGKPDG